MYNFGNISLKEKAVFTKNLALMLKSGLSISESLEILQDQASGKFKQIVRALAQSVQSGNAFAQALSGYKTLFSGFYINAVKAGEASGTLDASLENVAEYLRKEKDLKSSIQRAMFYPAIVLGLGFVIALVIAFFVLPKILPLFRGLKLKLPLTTRILIALADYIDRYGGRTLVALFIVGALSVWISRQAWIKPLTHKLILKIPIISGISRNRNLSVSCLTLGTLLKSGLSINEALAITARTVKNRYYRLAIENVDRKVSQGNTLSDSLAEQGKYFPKMATSMIKVGEKSGNLEEELLALAGMYEQEVDNATKLFATAIEPILLVIIGLMVGGLAVSIITPIYMITGGI